MLRVLNFKIIFLYHVPPVHCTDRLSAIGPLSVTDESTPHNITFNYVRNFITVFPFMPSSTNLSLLFMFRYLWHDCVIYHRFVL